jgi:membrane associated rhomboid family serine protease
MQQQTEVQSLLERGDDLLKNGRPTEAAGAFAQAIQLEPRATAAHLGLAEANLALNEIGMVYAACQEVNRLEPAGADAALARGMLAAVEGRYDAALTEVEQSVQLDPGRPYAHALRGYCLRQLGQRYEGALAEARAARGWGTRDFDHLFPKREPLSVEAQRPSEHAAQASPQPAPRQDIAPGMPQRISYDEQRQWQTQTPMQRRMIRARFLFRGIPMMTFCLLVINIGVYLACAVVSGNLFSPLTGYEANQSTGLFISAPNPIYSFGLEQGLLIQHDPVQIYRVVTAMFLHEGIAHIALNMLSLYFVGVVTEQIFGPWRFALLYFVAGIVGGLAEAFFSPSAVALGASGAIFGIFGAFGAFLLLRRQAFGRAANSVIANWLFWLALNIWFTLSNSSSIGVADHIGGLAAGLVLGAVLVSTARRRRAFG